jgi:hypothetical protein
MKNKFAIVCEWPEANAAENETIRRFKIASEKIKKSVVVINKYGNILDEEFRETSDIIDESKVDFVINLHFASPKCYDGFSFVALWNPLKFYFDWGYDKTSLNLLSHQDFISCLSDVADDHVKRLIDFNNSNHLYPKLVINHTNSGPYFEPNNKREKIFYCGINWDKTLGKSRFEEIFQALDNKAILKIYGPQKISKKIRPWKGFKSYIDEIPFDGVSIFKEISKCLLGLALSHEAHIESEIGTSRVFELIAGGALPICDENNFFIKNFGDKVLYVKGSDEDKIKQITEHYNWALNNKYKVSEMVENLQDYVKNNFDLSKQISNFYNSFQQRRREVEANYCAKEEKFKVNIFYFCDDDTTKNNIEHFLNSIKNQLYKNLEVNILIKKHELENLKVSNKYSFEINYLEHTVNDNNKIGLIIEQNLSNIKISENNLFLFTNKNECFFYDHISSMVRCFEDNENIDLVKSDTVYIEEGGFIKERNLIRKDGFYIMGNILFKKIPQIHVLKHISIARFSIIFVNFYGDKVKNSKRLTVKIYYPKNENLKLNYSSCLSVNQDVMFANQNSKVIIENQKLIINKELAYNIISKIRIFKIIYYSRQLTQKFNKKIKNFKKKIKLFFK